MAASRPHMDLVLTFKTLTDQRYEWTSPTAYKDSPVNQFVCEGSRCGQFARCTTMALGDYQLQ